VKSDIDLKKLTAKAKEVEALALKHFRFIALMFVLLVYVFMVWEINKLATAEPTDEQASAALDTVKVPKVDKTAIDKIQSLEQSSPAVHSLFTNARNNPFLE
jgi:hypothetical protein